MREIGRAEWIGTTARELMARRDLCGRVLAVVTGAVYLQTETRFPQRGEKGFRGNEILWLAQNHLPMHSRAIRGDFDSGILNVGMMFQSDGRCLRFENQATLQFANVRVWQPPTIDPTCVVPREIVMARAREIQDPQGSRARKLCGSLHGLVGLGEGLTPSGDDFIGGQLFTQWYLHAAYPDTVTWDQCAVDDLIEYARPRTNAISYALLRDHASGKSVEPLHNLVTALLHGKASDEVTAHARALRAIGSTSGWDMLVGAMTGMLLIERTH